MTTERDHLLQAFRSVLPGVAGVVLATLAGGVVAHERGRIRDPAALAAQAATQRDPATSTSALVQRDGALYLVVFVPPPLADQLASCGAAALPA